MNNMKSNKQNHIGEKVCIEPFNLIHKINQIANTETITNKKFKHELNYYHSIVNAKMIKQQPKSQPTNQTKKDFYSELIPNKSQRKKYVQYKQQLKKRLEMTMNTKHQNHITFILQHSILQSAFNDIVGQIKKQCKDKGEFIEFIWKQTFKLIEESVQKIIQYTNNQQRCYLQQIIQLHQQYLTLLDKNQQQTKQKASQLENSHKLLSSLMFGIKDRKKQNKNLSKAVKQLSQQVNNLRESCTDLQIQNLGYLISNNHTSQQQALLLQSKRQQLKKEKVNRVYISSRKQGKKKQEGQPKVQNQQFKLLTFSLLNLIGKQSQFSEPIQIEEEANINQLLIEDQIENIALKKGETNERQSRLSFRKYRWKFIDEAVDTSDLYAEKEYQNISTQFSFSQRAELYLTKNTSAQTMKQVKKIISSKQIGLQTNFNTIRNEYFEVKKAFELSFLFQNCAKKIALKLTTIPRNYIDNRSYLRSSRIVNRSQKFKPNTIKQQKPDQPTFQKIKRRSTKTHNIIQNTLRTSTSSNVRIFKNNKEISNKMGRPHRKISDEKIQHLSIMKSPERKLVKVNSSGQYNQNQYEEHLVRFASTQSEQFNIPNKGKIPPQFFSATHTPENIFMRHFAKEQEYRISQWEKQEYSSRQFLQKPDIIYQNTTQNYPDNDSTSLKLIKPQVHKRAVTGVTTPALQPHKRKPLKSKSIKSTKSVKSTKNIKSVNPVHSIRNIPAQFFRRTAPIQGFSIIDSTISEYFSKTFKPSPSTTPMILPNKLRVPTKYQLGTLVAKISGTNKVISPQNLYKILNQVYNCAYEIIGKDIQIDSFVTPITHYLEINYGKNKNIHFQNKIQHLLAQFYCYRNQHWAFREILVLLNLLNVENNIPFKQEINPGKQDLNYLENLNDIISSKDTMLFLKLLRRLSITWTIPLNVIDLYTNQARISKNLKKILLEQNIRIGAIESIQKDLFEQIKTNIMLKRQQQTINTKKSQTQNRQSVTNINVFKCCEFVMQKLGQSRKQQYEYYRSSIIFFKDFSNKKPLESVYEFCKLLIKLEFPKKIVEINKKHKLMKNKQQIDMMKKGEDSMERVFQKYFMKGNLLSLDSLAGNGMEKYRINGGREQMQQLCDVGYRSIKENRKDYVTENQALFQAVYQYLVDKQINEKNINLFQFRNLLLLNFAEQQTTTILEQIMGSDMTCLYCLSSWSLS